VEISPELVALGTDAIVAVFDLFDARVDLVIDEGFGSVETVPTADDAAEAEIAVFVVQEEILVEESDFFEHFCGVEGGASAGSHGETSEVEVAG